MKTDLFTARSLRKVLLIFLVVLLLGVELGYRILSPDGYAAEMLYLSLTRFIGGAVCIIFMLEFAFTSVMRPLGNKSIAGVLLMLPAFIVAINNFPFVSYASGDCTLAADPSDILLFAMFCLSVGFFEEIAFRGCVLMYLLKKRSDSKKGIFMSILWSSAVFGLIHLVNLLTDSPIAVILQIGYSTLIGALCSLVLLATKNIWLCVLLHAAYNFVGNVIPRLGEGAMWTPEQMVFTAAVGVVVLVYCIWWFFFSMPVQRAAELYESK
jgi:membrane protease YdiL (CAAX protease family)